MTLHGTRKPDDVIRTYVRRIECFEIAPEKETLKNEPRKPVTRVNLREKTRSYSRVRKEVGRSFHIISVIYFFSLRYF